MPLTLSPAAGDGVSAPAWRANINLPDSGTSIAVNGTYQPPLVGSGPPPGMQPIVPFGGTVTSPGVPGSGTNYWICTINTSTGALATQTSTSGFPTPSAGTAVVFQQSIGAAASAAPSLQGNLTFPWL